MISKQNITGIVLAGGRSSRMGTDKSLMIFNDKPLIQYAVDALKPVCDKVVISSNKSVYDFTGCEVWPDEIPQQAPIIGIYSSLKRSQTEKNILISCDMPFVPSSLFTFLLLNSELHDLILISHHNNRIEPLCGIYKKNLIPSLEIFIKKEKYKMIDFINTVSCNIMDINEIKSFDIDYIFQNFNTPEDFNKK